MNERDALLKAVCANPDDDTPRLVFADWLQENGEEDRAEFIRLQVRRASGAVPPGEWPRAVSREAALEEKHGKRWRAELPTGDPVQLEWAAFERGFAGELLMIYAKPFTPTGFGPLQWIGADISELDWEYIYRSVPFTRFVFGLLSTWHVPLLRPEAARIKSLCLNGCGFSAESLRVLAKWERYGGELRIHQDDLELGYEEKLRLIFGERYRRKRLNDF